MNDVRAWCWRLSGGSVLLAAGFWVYHLLLARLMRQAGLRLGAVGASAAPLYARWSPQVTPWLLLGLACLAVCLWLLWRTRFSATLGRWPGVGLLTGCYLAVAVSVAMVDGGPPELAAPLARTDVEYTGALDRVNDPAGFLRGYAGAMATLPMHVRTHPPGAVLFAWAARRVGLGPLGMALAIVLVTVSLVAVVHAWAWDLAGGDAANRAAVLFLFTPSVVLFTATSMDGPFAVALVTAMWLFWAALERRPVALGLAAGAAAGVGAMLTYSVAVAMLFCGWAAVLRLAKGRGESRGRALVASVAAATGFVAFHVALWLATGYDPVRTFATAVSLNREIMQHATPEAVGQRAHVAVGQLAALFFSCGLPVCLLWWREAGKLLRRAPASRLGQFVGATALTLAVATAAPLYTMEVERIWLFLTPLAVIPVAARLADLERASEGRAGTTAVATWLAAQSLLTEVLLSTFW